MPDFPDPSHVFTVRLDETGVWLAECAGCNGAIADESLDAVLAKTRKHLHWAQTGDKG